MDDTITEITIDELLRMMDEVADDTDIIVWLPGKEEGNVQ